MCGIAGTFNWGDQSHVARMAEVQSHRGPDDHGACYFPDERVGLGHRRLSIIDLSPAGHQPMSNDDQSIWITFNGEIYNFHELRAELEKLGTSFKSKSDTEVIIRLYERYGNECVKRLNGMFAFAILNRQKQKLLLARDHCGIKPLYYYANQGRFVFASEIKGILAAGIYSPEINWQGLHDYLTYLYVPCPETMFRDIYQVPPAHTLELDLQTNEFVLQRYWNIASVNFNGNGQFDYEAASIELRSLLTDSTKRQMISDVPLGVFLSGGVDSPILTGLMAAASSQPVKTFTVVFQGKNVDLYNEQEEAQAVARRFATEHHETTVDISRPIEMLSLIEHFDQPFGNPTFFLMYLISKAAREEVTVALSGAGGDELFAGYPRYRAMGLARWFHWLPQPLVAGAGKTLGLLTDDYSSATLRRARQFVGGLDADFAREFVNWTYFLKEDEKRLLRCSSGENDGYAPSERIVRRFLEQSGLTDEGNKVLHGDIQTFLPDNILEYTDKMSMAVSLEVRVPYLDYRVVEHSLAIPFDQKLRSGRSKAMLKDTFADLLSEDSLQGPKRGFNFPLAVWMRDCFDDYFETTMNRQQVEKTGIFNWSYIQLMREQHRSGKNDHSYPLFSLIMFDVWYRRYITGK